MRELLDTLAGDIPVFGYSVPSIVLLACGLFLFSAFSRSLWPAMFGGLILFAVYFILPAMSR